MSIVMLVVTVLCVLLIAFALDKAKEADRNPKTLNDKRGDLWALGALIIAIGLMIAWTEYLS